LRLSLLPFGEVKREVLEKVAKQLDFFQAEIKILPPISNPMRAYNPIRKQYLADFFLEEARMREGDRVLGIASVDLFAGDLNFVFGQAEIGGKAAVISICRLASEDNEVYLERIVKEAVHELGHTFGLRHCPDKYCVMHFSNCLADTDLKGRNYCERCLQSLPF